jgi:uncharacterized protein (TIGR01777 family)
MGRFTNVRVVIPGGSGQVGTIIARAFPDDEVTVIGRGGPVAWDGRTLGPWAEAVDGADVVINLAGRSVNCRYNEANRRAIMDSRVDSTRVLGEAIARAANPPRVWLQSSTATIYAGRYDAPNDERTGIIGDGFSVGVAQAWEQAAIESCPPGTRLVLLRSAMVMSPDRGGIFDVVLGLVRHRLGGSAAGGRQYVSWIHGEDFTHAIRFLIESKLAGPVNVAAPNPLPYAEFMRALREAWGTRIGLPATRWMLELGAWAMRTETELVLKSRRVVPARLADAGFTFDYPEWPAAARDLVAEWRARR